MDRMRECPFCILGFRLQTWSYEFKLHLPPQPGQSFGDITWEGVKDVGAQPPRPRPKRLDSEYEPGFGSSAYFKKRARNCCTEKTLKRKFPVAQWLPNYNLQDTIGDLIAGVTVFFTIIPQCIAFAELATVPAQASLL
jgi:hypothetical protein